MTASFSSINSASERNALYNASAAQKNVYIYCEGQTEEAFINGILAPYFANMGIWVIPIICVTKRTASKKFKGGVSNYDKIRNELQLICRQHKKEIVTTMFDYYAMPTDTPMIDCNASDIYERIRIIEAAIDENINQHNFFFNFSLHEFEGLLFSNPQSFALIAKESTVMKIQSVRDEFPSPEHINNSVETAPSKRLNTLIPGYANAKVRNGTLVSTDMGIDPIIKSCPHFAEWIRKIIAKAQIEAI